MRIILRAVKGDRSCTRAQFTSVKKSVTGNLACPSSEEVVVFVHHRVL